MIFSSADAWRSLVHPSPRASTRWTAFFSGTIAILACTGQAADQKALFPKALVTTEDVQEAIRTEWSLQKNYETFAKDGEDWFAVLPGTSKVLISAPHATAQMREGKLKFADAGTGALAVMLHKLVNTTVIYTTHCSPSDPNFYDDNDYKRKLEALIKEAKPSFVFDLHASHWYRPYDVDFGTLNGLSIRGKESWFRRIADFFSQAGYRNFSQDDFAAVKNQTVTKFVWKMGVPCLQFEINETWLSLFDNSGIKIAPPESEGSDIANDALRIDEQGAHRFAETLEALIRSVNFIDGKQPPKGPSVSPTANPSDRSQSKNESGGIRYSAVFASIPADAEVEQLR